MAIRHVARRGDSLWSLARRYLGSGTKYPQIVDFHNRESACMGSDIRLYPIKDPNLIYVSQIILIPPKTNTTSTCTGEKSRGNGNPLPVNLKIEYTIGRDTPRLQFIRNHVDYTIITEMTGKFAIEMTSADRYRHSLELLMSKNPAQVKQKLGEVYDPVLQKLIARPEMIFESGQVKIQLATEAKLGPYNVTVEFDTPNHLTGRLTSLPATGAVKIGRKEFEYSAELEFTADVFMQPRPDRPEKIVKVPSPRPEEKRLVAPKENAIDWNKIAKETDKIIAMVSWTIIGTAMLWYTSTLSTVNQTRSMAPFMHTIDPDNPRNSKYANRNPGMI